MLWGCFHVRILSGCYEDDFRWGYFLDAFTWRCFLGDTGRGALDVPDSRRKIRDAGQWTWDSERVGQWTRKTVDVDKAVRFRDSPWAKNGNQAQMTHEMCKTADVDKTLPRSAASGSRLV